MVTHTTVAATYKEMEDKGKLIKFTSLIGADDKEHPRQVERKPIFKPTKPVSLFVVDRARTNSTSTRQGAAPTALHYAADCGSKRQGGAA